jgi:hypothetical protein
MLMLPHMAAASTDAARARAAASLYAIAIAVAMAASTPPALQDPVPQALRANGSSAARERDRDQADSDKADSDKADSDKVDSDKVDSDRARVSGAARDSDRLQTYGPAHSGPAVGEDDVDGEAARRRKTMAALHGNRAEVLIRCDRPRPARACHAWLRCIR